MAMIKDKKNSMTTSLNTITFLMNGISSVLGWNAVLSSFDYYNSSFPDNSVYTWFPVPLFFMQVLVGVYWKEIQKRYSYKTLVMSGLLIINVCMIILPMAASFMRGSNMGFVTCLAICGIIGFASNITQLSFFAIINFMTVNIVSVYNQGMAVSGLTMILLRMLILSFKGTADSTNFSSLLKYLILTIIVNTVDIILNLKFFMSDHYQNQIQPQIFHRNKAKEQDKQQKKQQIKYLDKLLNAHKQIFPFDALIFFNYIQTFMLFPSLTFKKKFDIDPVWGIAILNLVFNLGDLAGRYFCSHRNYFTKKSLIYIFVARFVFCWTIIIIAKDVNDPLISGDGFAFLNLFLFAFTNGIATNGNFIMAFETVKINKSEAGVLCGLLLQIGIFCGTLVAVPLIRISN